MQSEVPWGKHNPVATFRGTHFAPSSRGANVTAYLPVMLVKDPLTWFKSMCRNAYAARFRVLPGCPRFGARPFSFLRLVLLSSVCFLARRAPHFPPRGVVRVVHTRLGSGRRRITAQLCVSLCLCCGAMSRGAGAARSRRPRAMRVRVRVRAPSPISATKGPVAWQPTVRYDYDSLAHLWSEWNRAYADLAADVPRLVVRYEDLLFDTERTMATICACAGAEPPASDTRCFF